MSSKGSDIVAGDQGAKPSVHIGVTDAKIAEEQGRGQKSMSTVMSSWGKESRKLHSIRDKKREIMESDTKTIEDLYELWNMIEVE